MTIYIVSMSTTQGPHGPTVNMWYFKDHQEGLDEFTECTKSLSEDPSTILLVRLNTDTMTEEVLESFEGTEEDYMDQCARRIREERVAASQRLAQICREVARQRLAQICREVARERRV